MVTLKSLFTSNIFLAIIFNVIYVYFYTKHFINTVSTYLRSRVCLKQAAQLWLLDNASTQHSGVSPTSNTINNRVLRLTCEGKPYIMQYAKENAYILLHF